jgi:hypothetical protein
METVFSMWFFPSHSVPELKLSGVQLSGVTLSSWLVSESVQLHFSCRLSAESISVKRRLRGWCEMAASL